MASPHAHPLHVRTSGTHRTHTPRYARPTPHSVDNSPPPPLSPPSPNLASDPPISASESTAVSVACAFGAQPTPLAARRHHPQPYVSPLWYPSPPRPPSLRPSATLQFIGLLLECIVEDVASPDNQGEDAHLTLHSAHDRTIIALLSALGLHGVEGASFPSYCRGPTYSSPLSHRAVVVAPGPRSRIRPRRPRP